VSDGKTFAESLVQALDACASFSPDAESAPVAILWPDKGRQWERVVGRVAKVRPVLTVGAYDAGAWTGPAIWVRCVVDGAITGPELPGVPIVYLPGYERAQIRSAEDAPDELRCLLELQHRGVTFAQLSGRDWTLSAFLQAAPTRGGLGIEVGSDDATKTAMRAASDVFALWRIGDLRDKAPLRADFFNVILVPDLGRNVLEWLNDPGAFDAARTPDQIHAFRGAFREFFKLDLVSAGEIAVAQQLGRRESDAWGLVWQAYSDAPTRYPLVEDRLRAAKPKAARDKGPTLFEVRGAWPQDNEKEESDLRAQLVEVGTRDAESARIALIELEQIHAERRDWVWARQGRAPLAFALKWLAELSRQTRKKLPEGSIASIVSSYATDGWKADDAILRALAQVETPADVDAVGAASAAVYCEWLEVGAERLQKAVGPTAAEYVVPPLDAWPEGTAVIFTDGLRYDVGRRLGQVLETAGMTVEVQSRLTALPTITPTGKPAASPAISRLVGGSGFETASTKGGTKLTADGLRKEIAAAGYQILGTGHCGDPSGRAWAEQGNIDSLGHDEQRLAPLLDSEVHKLELRVAQLLAAGWAKVVVVTDHGWLYLPGGLPKAELPLHLAENALRKGRAARLAEGATTDVPTVPWFWDSTVRVAVAPGIRSFVGSPVYEHGGLSPQECITPVVIATAGASAAGPIDLEVTWSGLRARVSASGAPAGATVDLRRKAGDPGTTVIGGGVSIGTDGAATFLIGDEELEGVAAFLLVLDSKHVAIAQRTVTIGENE
jgi:PglZ domain